MGGKRSKSAGTSFEYRVRKWFNERDGWSSERNPLSGASEQFTEAVGKHDVRAWKNDIPIFLQLECKKRTRTKDPKKRKQIEILWDWLKKIDFDKDELLVVGFDRSDLYAFLTTDRFFKILGRSYDIEYDKHNTYSGQKQFALSLENLQENYNHIYWESHDTEYTVLLLEDYITLRETANLDEELAIEERIKRCQTVDSLEEIESEMLDEMSYTQKRLLYQKFEQLESDSFINPKAMAETQFWLDDEAFVCVCPHCDNEITKGDLKADEESA